MRFISSRKERIIDYYGFSIPFNIYSLFTTAFLISLVVILLHLLYAVLINPFVWNISDKNTRVLPHTFLKLWALAIVLLIILVTSIYFLIRYNLTDNFIKNIHRKIHNYIVSYYGTYNQTYIKLTIILWLILNRESFLIFLGAPFVPWPSFNKKKLINIESDSNNSFYFNNLYEEQTENNYTTTKTLSNNYSSTTFINSNIDYELSETNSYSFDVNHNKNINNFSHSDPDSCISDMGDVSIITESVNEKLSSHNYRESIISKEELFHSKYNPSYTDEQSKIISMYQNIKHGFLIVCHNSSDVLPATLECLLKVTTPMCIFIAENGSNPEEKQKMKEIIDEFSIKFRLTHPSYQGLNIIYANLNEGSKTLAQFCLLNNLFWFGINIKYISVIDDDVLIPENWVEEEILSYFNDPKVKALAYPITASNRREGIVPAFQNFEYILSMYSKKIHRDIGTVVFPSGAMGTWSIPFLLECLYLHDTVFRGDDLQLGLRLHTMYGKPRFCDPNNIHDGNYKIEMAHVTVDTFVPGCYIHLKEYLPNFLGKYLKDCACGQYSLSRQRIVYWEPARHRFLLKFLDCIFHKCKLNHRATLTAKLFCIDFVVTVFNDYLFIVLLVYMFLMKSFLPALMIICICFALAYLSLDIFNIVIARGKPEIKLPFEVCVIFPICYQFVSTLFYRISTIIYTLSYYVPFVRNNVKINKRALKKDISNMTMNDIFTETDSEKAIAYVSDVSIYLNNRKRSKRKIIDEKMYLFKNKFTKETKNI
ncbi:hypothetical protein BCR36DRAFT_440018 [Piromyces finnis]|uniref:Uncharacterized protein n=1 Tax=Piromyces finnis TaxID=1754191 RepID=A0A1Y1VQ44_9FUNG|nr:hypothetical protein BCR36DRAFT_440018 [Piromyces finnis]|eukprot:ORX61272.1 hypothetical protein BCR36DRAFT_440018 [Piromyces finnis]